MTNKAMTFQNILIGLPVYYRGEGDVKKFLKEKIRPIYDKCSEHNLKEIDRIYDKCVDICNKWVREQKNKVLNSQLS
jgi:hypothetical protein